MRHPSLFALLALAGCSHIANAFIDTSGKAGRSVEWVEAPKVDRCRALKDPDRRADCEDKRQNALVFVRKLAVDDQVCLEGNSLLDGVTHFCKVRAFVADASPRNVKLEIRDAPPTSRYRPMEDYWFAEEALADLYLKSLGFAAPRPP
jgi:hypothetical protein